MVDRVRNRRRNADNADLAEPLDAERIAVVWLVDEDDPDVMYIGIYRHMILGEIAVHETAISVVDHALFVQRHADTPDHAAQDLAARGLGVQDTPGGNRADDARDANHAKLLVNLNLSKDCCVSVVSPRGVISGICSFFLLDAIYRTLPHGVSDRNRSRWLGPAHQLAIHEYDLVGGCVGKWGIWRLLGQTQQPVADRLGSRRDPVRH